MNRIAEQDCLPELIVIEDDDGKHSTHENTNNQRTQWPSLSKEMKELRIKNAEQKRRIEQLEDQNDDLLLELASLKMDASASAATLKMELSASSGVDGGSGGGACVVVAATTSNNDQNEDAVLSNGGGHNSNATIPVRYDMSSSAVFDFDGGIGSTDSSLCEVAANDSFSNNDDTMGTGEHATNPVNNNMSISSGLFDGTGSNDLRLLDENKEEVISYGGGNNSNATIPVRHDMSSSSGFDLGDSEASLCYFDDGSSKCNSSTNMLNADGSQSKMTFSSYIEYRYGGNNTEEAATPTTSNSSSNLNVNRRNTSANIMPRCSSHGARRATICASTQNAYAAASSASCASMENSSTSVDLVTDYGYGDTYDAVPTNATTGSDSFIGNMTVNGRRDMMVSSSTQNTSRRSLFRRKSEIISPRCSPHGSRRNSAMTSLNNSEHTCTSVDYEYGDTEDVVPTSGYITAPASGRRDLMISSSSSTQNTSRRSLFRRKSGIISPRCSPHGSRRNSAISLSTSSSSTGDVDYEYGDTEDVVPTTTEITCDAHGRQEVSRTKSSTSNSRTKSSTSNRRVTICECSPNLGTAARRAVTLSATRIGRRKTVCGRSPTPATPSSTRSVPGRRISSASTDLLRIYNGFISLDDMTADDDDVMVKPPLILENPIVQ
jgi:hypothetical protein